MKHFNKIAIFLFFLIILSGFSAYAQILPTVCGGSIERYRVMGSPNSVFEWDVGAEGEIVNIYYDGDSVDIRWYGVNGGIKNITVTETTQFGCTGNPYSQSVVVSVPFVDIGLDVEICNGETYEFVAIASDVNSYLWQDSTTIGDRFVASIAGNYWVAVSDSIGCSATDSAYLTVHDLPVVDLGNDTILCGADETLLLDVYNSTFNSYEWWLDSESQSFESDFTVSTHSQTQEVWVEVGDLNGCIGYDTLIVAFCGEFYVPNVFTPNDDGDNDTWEIDYIDAFPDVAVEVYNRFGDRVFSSKGYVEPWDGTDAKGKKLPMDTYYYVMDFKNGEPPKVGSVTIVR